VISIFFITILKYVAISIGAGATTVLIAQSFVVTKDHKVTKDEQNLLGIVMLLIRMSILLLFLSHAWLTAVVYTSQNIYIPFSTGVNTASWSLLGILFVTFVFIDYAIISRQTGVSVLVSTWYSLIFLWEWPLLVTFNLDAFMMTYTIFTSVSVFIIWWAHKLLSNAQFLPTKTKS
jgi:hypothetical protein